MNSLKMYPTQRAGMPHGWTIDVHQPSSLMAKCFVGAGFSTSYLHALVIHPDDGSYQSIDNDSNDGDDNDIADDCCGSVKRRLVSTLR